MKRFFRSFQIVRLVWKKVQRVTYRWMRDAAAYIAVLLSTKLGLYFQGPFAWVNIYISVVVTALILTMVVISQKYDLLLANANLIQPKS